MSILEVSGLRKVYTTRFGGSRVEALRSVSFTVEQGEYVAIMGESGSGKTTLLNILAALDEPTAGTVRLEGRELHKIREKDAALFRRENLGFVFQEFNLLDTFTLEDNIYLPLVLAGMGYEDMRARLMPIAKLLGLTELLKKYPYEVSGGQKQRAAVARAIITEPKLLLADEPTGALDSGSTDELLRLFADINRAGQTILMVTHSVKAASRAGRVLFIKDGQVYVAALRTEFHSDTLSIDGGMTRHVMKREIPALVGAAVADITPSLTVVVPDFEQFVPELQSYLTNKYGWYPTATWHYAFDTDLPENQQGNIDGTTPNLKDALDDYLAGVSSDWGVGVSVESKAGNRADFYGTYGGLFFLGIMLSIVFIFAAVAILYYKQLSEGYEDQSRFDIMQKVGMTKGDIRRSINSQLLTVFYLPLLMAGLHLCFAFPFIHKLLMLFNLDNRGLLVGTTAVSFAVFAALYALVYKLTGNAYYHIVADNKE